MSTAFIVHRVGQGAFGPIPSIMEGMALGPYRQENTQSRQPALFQPARRWNLFAHYYLVTYALQKVNDGFRFAPTTPMRTFSWIVWPLKNFRTGSLFGVLANLLTIQIIPSKTGRYSALESLFHPQNGHSKGLQVASGT